MPTTDSQNNNWLAVRGSQPIQPLRGILASTAEEPAAKCYPAQENMPISPPPQYQAAHKIISNQMTKSDKKQRPPILTDVVQSNDHPVDLSLPSAKVRESLTKIPSPSVPAPSVPGPSVPGPSVLRPSVPGPSVSSPLRPAPSVPSPSRPAQSASLLFHTRNALQNKEYFSTPQPSVASQQQDQTQPQTLKQTILACGHCSFKTSSNEQIQSHILHSHQQYSDIHMVPQSSIVVNSSPTLPMFPTANRKTFSCNHCAYRTSSELCMVRHLLTLHRSKLLPVNASMSIGDEKIFSCSYCNFSSNEVIMVKHMLDHYQKHVPCNACSSCINWKYPVIPLQRKSSGKGRPSKKDYNPTKRKNRSSSTKIQKSDKAFSCVICKFCCDSSAQLQKHLSTHVIEASKVRANNTSHDIRLVSKTVSVPLVNPEPVLPISNALIASPASKNVGGTIDCDLPTPPGSDSDGQLLNDCSTNSSANQQSTSLVHDVTPNKKLVDVDNQMECNVSKSDSPEHSQIQVNGASEHISTETLASYNISEGSDGSQSSQLNTQVSMSCVAKISPETRNFSAERSNDNSNNENISAINSSSSPLPKKRRLSVKIFKNTSGQYELESQNTPEPNSNCNQTCSDLDLSVRIPLSSLPCKPKVVLQTNEATKERDHIPTEQRMISSPTQVNFNQMSIEISHALTSDLPTAVAQFEIENDDIDGVEHAKMEPVTCKQEGLLEAGCDHDHKSGKTMAHMLKKKLSNIYLKVKQDPDTADGLANENDKDDSSDVIILLDSDDEIPDSAEMKPARTPCPGNSDAFSNVVNPNNGAFIDLTLDDSDSDDSGDGNVQICAAANITCTVEVDRLPSQPESNIRKNIQTTVDEDIEHANAQSVSDNIGGDSDTEANSIASVDPSTSVKPGTPTLATKYSVDPSTPIKPGTPTLAAKCSVDPSTPVKPGTPTLATKCSVDPSTPVKPGTPTLAAKCSVDPSTPVRPGTPTLATKCSVDPSTPVKPGTPALATTCSVGVSDIKLSDTDKIDSSHQPSECSQKPRPARNYKQIRKRNGLCSTHSVSQTSVRDGVNTIDDDDLVVCPFCPKRLLYRLLPAHVQFHDSDCEHKCKDCNFASSFKWALETHILCHKEAATAVKARQISPDEWRIMKNGNLTDDEEVGMAQKLIIKESVQHTTRQIAKKSVPKKIDMVGTALNKKSTAYIISTGTVSDKSVRVDKTKMLCTEDFFAKMLTDRTKPKK